MYEFHFKRIFFALELLTCVVILLRFYAKHRQQQNLIDLKKIYYLSTCDTCQRILKELKLSSDYNLQDIKQESITLSQLEEMYKLAGSYESLFSKRARLYKERDLKNKSLKEEDYKNLILEHYTFLKRPVLIIENSIFVGNAKKTIEAAKTALNE